MKLMLCFLWGAALLAEPLITKLEPRGIQKGKPFTLTLSGRDLGEGAKIWSTMPATFTPLAPEKTGMSMAEKSASFLVEPKGDIPVGVYPIRVETPEGISNIELFAVGSFPEFTEDESRAGALPNTNDTIESAQALPSAPFTLNGTLRGPERDVYRYSAQKGEKRVFEIEARRCGSAIDPVIEIVDQSGKTIAKSEDAALIDLDARAEVTFPREGFYYVMVHDARYSTQADNFYRLKAGSYPYVTEVFPLGARRGEVAQVSLGSQKIQADLRNVEKDAEETFINLPGSATLPVLFAVGDDPEVTQPVTDAIPAPVTINGRLSKPGEVDRYKLRVTPGEPLILRMHARELGTSKLMAVITVLDAKGKQLGRSGDEPLAEDVYNVNTSRTAGDPILRVEAPKDATELTVTVEDLALRGGPNYGYRLNVKQLPQDFRLVLNTPYINVPAGGSVAVPVTVQRQGYDGEIQLSVANPPKGLKVEGGFVVAGPPVKANAQNRFSRGVLVFTAEPGASLTATDLEVRGAAKLPDGSALVRTAEGPGMMVNVNGATQQGAVDRQRPLTAPWLDLKLPVARTAAQPATLEVSMVERKVTAEGDQFKFRWKWNPVEATLALPKTVSAELVGAGDTRVIDSKQDEKDPTIGTFTMTTTKLTRASKYDLYVTGRLKIEGRDESVVSRPIPVQVDEVKATDDAQTAAGR
jgi:hypothetical protein